VDGFEPTASTTLRRHPERGRHDRDTVYEILDRGLVCHVGFVDRGRPFVLPTSYGRDGDILYLHASSASRIARTLAAGTEVCVTVTLVDGLVLARSAFSHSMNYRSVLVLGRATLVDDPDRKLHGLRVIVEHVAPGRWDSLRPVLPKELLATSLLAVPLREASAKVRTGPPKDPEEDLGLGIWAGVVPLVMSALEPVPDDPDLAVPEHVRRLAGRAG
jgi:nitroimidazol reductase NimA-like FMN-containing flavoprotein (pyridoxamine 5'-phosphate oxidase superfamily)